MTATAVHPTALAAALEGFEPWRDMLWFNSTRGERRQDVLPCEKVLEPSFFNRCIDHLADQLGTDQRLAVVSLWCKYYDASVVTGVLAAMVLRGVGIDASLHRTGMLMRDGLPRGLALPHDSQAIFLRQRWPASCGALPVFDREADDVKDLQRVVWHGAFASHLEPFVRRVADMAGIRARILWANIGSRCAYLYDIFAREAPSASEEDRLALLEQQETVWAEGRNPMHKPVRYQCITSGDGLIHAQVRKTCCLRDRLPDTTLCANCPRLSAEQRAQMLAAKGQR